MAAFLPDGTNEQKVAGDNRKLVKLRYIRPPMHAQTFIPLEF